jgi:hypothetical protein
MALMSNATGFDVNAPLDASMAAVSARVVRT